MLPQPLFPRFQNLCRFHRNSVLATVATCPCILVFHLATLLLCGCQLSLSERSLELDLHVLAMQSVFGHGSNSVGTIAGNPDRVHCNDLPVHQGLAGKFRLCRFSRFAFATCCILGSLSLLWAQFLSHV